MENKIELINNLVSKLSYFTQEYDINSLFIVGDFCFNLYMDLPQKINKIEVCVAYPDQVIQLASLFATEVNETTVISNKDTNVAIIPGEIPIEFQSKSSNRYMYNQEIQIWMQNERIQDIPIIHNLYGRDFTMNTLMYSLYTEKIYDNTKLAVKGIDDKRLITLIPPKMLVKYNPIIILEAIKLSLFYKFYINAELQNAMRSGSHLLPQYISIKQIINLIITILKIDHVKGLQLLKKYKLNNYLLLPETKKILKEYHD